MSTGRRLIVLGVGPALLLAAVVLPFALWWGDLPDPTAVHWGLSGEPDGSLPPAVLLAGLVVLSAAVWVSVLLTVRRMPSESASFVAGLYGIVGLLAGIGWMTVLAGLDAAAWRDADPIGWPHLAVLLGSGALAALAGWVLAGRRDDGMPAPPGSRIDVPHPEHAVWASRARSRVLTAGGIALIAGGLVVWGPATVVLVVAGLAVLAFAGVRVTVGSRGVVVGLGWLGFPNWMVPASEITGGSTEQVLPMAYGGWGYRIRPGVRAVIVRGGEALRVQRERKADLVVTVDDAATGAGVVDSIAGTR